MALQVDTLKRKFTIKKGGKDVDLADPNPEMTPQDVIKFYSSEYPELTNSTVEGPKVEGGKAVYSFKTSVGTKG
jgi:PRTRC genetic system protein C